MQCKAKDTAGVRFFMVQSEKSDHDVFWSPAWHAGITMQAPAWQSVNAPPDSIHATVNTRNPTSVNRIWPSSKQKAVVDCCFTLSFFSVLLRFYFFLMRKIFYFTFSPKRMCFTLPLPVSLMTFPLLHSSKQNTPLVHLGQTVGDAVNRDRSATLF